MVRVVRARARIVLLALTGCSLAVDTSGLAGGDATGRDPTVGGAEAGVMPPDGGPSGGDGAPSDATTPKGPPVWRAGPAGGPTGRHSARMVDDEARQRLVLFGGASDT